MGLIKDKLIKSGKPVVGALVVLREKDTHSAVEKTTTDKYGIYRFDNVQPGVYEILFYGSYTDQSDNIEEIVVPPDDMTGIEPLFFDNIPTLFISEGFSDTDVNGSEYVEVIVSLSDINVNSGKIVDIVLEHRKDGTTEYTELSRYKPQDTNPASITWKTKITLDDKPEKYDFRAYYFNGNGDIGKIGSTVVESQHLGVVFNGIPDIYEYIEVPGLSATNTANPYSGDMPSDEINLEWLDLKTLAIKDKKKPSSEKFYPIKVIDAFGNVVTLTRSQGEKITGYVLYMFISEDGNPPINRHPAQEAVYNAVIFDESEWDYVGFSDEGTDNIWVYIGEYAKPYASGVRCPRGKTIYFWCGAKMDTTESKIKTKKYIY